jgi:myo-inositol 2-dehydrogenase / D-chiro-inositol 1-dehydrogenase
MTYADGCTIVLDGENRDKEAPFLEGPEGRLFRGFESDIPGTSRRRWPRCPTPSREVTDFAESVRTRRRFALERAERPPLLHARQPGEDRGPARPPLRFDPAAERFVGDEEANRLVDQPLRAPWRLPA